MRTTSKISSLIDNFYNCGISELKVGVDFIQI